MQHSKLSEHTFKKGKFITPFNSISVMQALSDKNHGLMEECQNIFGLD